MKDHVIICGFGRMGAAVAHELQQAKMKFVIIEWDAKRQELIREKGWDFVEGDATQDEILLRCHIQEARAIACVLPNDAENLLAVMSAKLLNNRCFIVTRANSDDVIPKLERAGANRIVSPYSAGAVRMANLIQTPALQDFYEIAKLKENKIDMDYVKVSEKSPFLGKKLEDCLRGRKGLSVVGAKNQKGELYIPVPPGLEIKAGDSYFVVGEAELMKDFVTNLV